MAEDKIVLYRARVQSRGNKSYSVLLLFLLLLATACSITPSELPQRISTPSPIHNTYHGDITYATTQFPESANPLFASSTADFALNAALWAQPVFYDSQFHVHPDQLTEVPLPENGGVRDGGKTILLHLRHDLRWSDGQPILASDFSYWWHLNQNPDTGATTRSGYDQIASIDTPDTYTIVLHMKHPFGPYLFYLPYAAPQHAWETVHPIDLQNTSSVFQSPRVTSGPYELKSMQESRSYTLVPNSYYVSSSFHTPSVSQLIFRTYDSTPSLITAIQQHNVDITTGYTEDEAYSLLTHLPTSTKAIETSAAAYTHLEFNTMKSLFADVHVREAIQKAINACNLIITVLHTSDCSRRATQVEPLPSLYYDANIHPVQYDLSAAKHLLDQSGWLLNAHGTRVKNGRLFTVQLVTTQSPTRIAVATYIQHSLVALGIQVQLTTYTLSTFFDVYTKGGILATGAYDIALFTYANSPEPDDEYAVFHSSQIPDADHSTLSNYARIHDAVLDDALTQGRNTIAFSDRVTAYHRFLERLAQQVYVIPLYVESVVMTVDTHVQHVILNPNQALPTWNISDWSAT